MYQEPNQRLVLILEVASVTLSNTHKENQKAKNERSYAHLLFFIV